jgi:uncharacterized protein
MRAVWVALVACVALFLSAPNARASFVAPPIEGHVTDTAGVLKQEERAELEFRLTEYYSRSGVEIAAFVAGSLQGQSIEDAAYTTFNTWRVGRAGLDNGVLLVIAPNERRIRIETGKGVGGQLTDLQASDIIEHRIAPQLRAGRYRDAIADGTDAIAAALGSQPTLGPSVQAPPMYVGVLVILAFIAIALLRARFGWPLFWWGGGSRRGGGFRGGGGGYSGGGGRSGGGGASGSW